MYRAIEACHGRTGGVFRLKMKNEKLKIKNEK